MPWRELEKQAEANSPQIYRAVIEGAPAMLWLGDAEGKCVFLNKMLRDFWGVTLEDISSFDWTSSLHPEDIDHLTEPFRVAMETRSEMQVEARYRRADGEYRILRTTAQPRFSETGEFLGMVGVNTDVTEQRTGEERLKQTMASLTLATNASRLGWGTWDTEAGTAEWDSRACEILGLSAQDATPEALWQRVHTEDRAAVRSEVESCIEAKRAFDVLFRVHHPEGKVMRVHGTGSLQKTAGGVRGTGLVRDVTEQAREEEFHQLVIQELGHRIKNLLGLVNSLVSQTHATGDPAEYKAALQGRLWALGASVGVVGYGSSGSVDLHDLAEVVLRPYLIDQPARIRLSGPSCQLPERYARIVGLALHELTTNAVKYGALSYATGNVDLRWDLHGDGGCRRLQMIWTETGGPAVKPPSSRGFGSRLLEDVVAMETEAQADLSFQPTGLQYSLDLPIEHPTLAYKSPESPE